VNRAGVAHPAKFQKSPAELDSGVQTGDGIKGQYGRKFFSRKRKLAPHLLGLKPRHQQARFRRHADPSHPGNDRCGPPHNAGIGRVRAG